MYSNVWLSNCWGPSSPRNISMDIHGLAGRQAWFTDGGRGQSYVGSHGKMRRFSWCRCWISQHSHTMSAMFEERVFMYLYVFLWIDQCGPQVSPKIISNLVLSDEDVRYRLVHLRSTAARPSSWPCHILPELQPLQPQESGQTEASVANRWLAGHWKEGPVIVENRRSQKMREWSPKHVLRPSGTSLHTLSYVSFRVCLGLMISFFKQWVVDYRMLEMLDTPVAQICVRAPSTWQKLSDPSLMCQKLLHSMDKQWRFFSSSGEQPGVCWLSAQVLKLNIKHSILIYYINIICVYIYTCTYIYIHT